MSTHANMVKMTVTSVASAGVGTITLNAASTGFQSLGTAYGGNATVDILITEGATWEVARNCTYTHSGTTVTRGTLEASSTGSAVAFTSAAVVSVVATAASGTRWDQNSVERVAGTDADVTMAIGSNYMVDMSAWATADRNYTLPAATGSGRRISVQILGGNASYELILKTDAAGVCKFAGSSIASSTEITRLFITGETMTFLDDATNVWKCEQDGRIPCSFDCSLKVDVTTNTAATAVKVPFTNAGGSSPDSQVGGCYDTSAEAFTVRRAGSYSMTMQAKPYAGVGAGQYFVSRLADSAGTTIYSQAFNYGAVASSFMMVPTSRVKLFAVGATICGYFAPQEANRGARGPAEAYSTYMSVVEVLK